MDVDTETEEAGKRPVLAIVLWPEVSNRRTIPAPVLWLLHIEHKGAHKLGQARTDEQSG